MSRKENSSSWGNRLPVPLSCLMPHNCGSKARLASKDVCVCAKSLQLCTILCDPMDRHLPGSSVHKILQTRILEGVATSPGDLPNPGIEPASPVSSALGGGFFTSSATWEAGSPGIQLLNGVFKARQLVNSGSRWTGTWILLVLI